MLVREQNLIQEKMQAQMERNGLDAMIVTGPESIYYATGMASMFAYISGKVGMAVAVVPKTGKATLICSEFEAYAARSICTDINVLSYPVWIYIADLDDGSGKPKDVQPDMNRAFRMASEVIRSSCADPKKVGIEWAGMTYDSMLFLQQEFGADCIVDCASSLIEARVIKTPWEIETLRIGAQASERAMFETAQKTQIGMTEQDLYHVWNQACLNQGKEFYDVQSSHTLADQYSPVVIPRDLPHLKEGDLVRLDCGPYYKGYTTDIARTYVVGDKVDPERERILSALVAGNDAAFAMMGPGVRMCDVYKACSTAIKKYIPTYMRGHYGHSIGTTRFTEEYPFFSETETRVLEPGMVLCLETPYYSTFNSSYNQEDTFLVTENGIDRFTTINKSLFWR